MVDTSVITNNGKKLIGNNMDGTTNAFVQYLGWTDDSAAVAAADSALTGEDSDPRILPVQTYYTTATNKQSFIYILTAGAGNTPGTIAKIGLFTDLTSGILFSETLLGSAIVKNSGKEVQVQIDIAIT
jgi:hypothetical protein